MATKITTNHANPVADKVFDSSAFINTRDSFLEWLIRGNAKKFSPQVTVACLDRISEYVVSEKISRSLWEISKTSVYASVYQKVMSAKLLRIMERDTYKTFTVAGQLYAEFLKERPQEELVEVISASEVPVTEKKAQHSSKEKPVLSRAETSSSASENSKLLFRKYVDLSLLKYGFTIPQSAINAFCANTTGDLQRGSSLPISLVLNEVTYPATLSNVGFTDATRQQIQVRYSPNSPIAVLFREIFVWTYKAVEANRRGAVDSAQTYEFIEITALSADVFGITCRPSAAEHMAAEITAINQSAETLTLIKDKCLIIKTRQNRVDSVGLYEATRYAWVLRENRLVDIDYVLSTVGGEIKEVYADLSWYRAEGGRFAFNGAVAEDEIRKKYVGKRIPGEYRKRGMASPTLYTFSAPQNGETRKRSGGLTTEAKHKITETIAENFKNGLRVSSNIDFDRFKKFYSEKFGEDFKLDADWFNRFVSEESLIFDERAYFYSDEVVAAVRRHMEELESPCVFMGYFYDEFADEFYNMNIFSVDKLKAFIEKHYLDISVKWDYIFMESGTSPSDLIRGVFNERDVWSFDEMYERLPYLKTDTIRQTMNSTNYYRIAVSTYTHIDNMDLPDSEGEKILAFANDKLNKQNYVTANELDLSVFENLNHHCPFSAIRDAVFYKFLSEHYDKSGQIITRKGEKLRAIDVLEQYCREAQTVSFEEINNLEATLDPEGRTHSQCLIAGHNVMVRVSEDSFVAESAVDFDVDKIDDAIALYCRENFIPLKGITDFSLFPYAGYPWNLFLLESYVRKFSRVFAYEVRAVNSSNIGAIVRKFYQYNDYDDILAAALADSLVDLEGKTEVGNYLFESGYIGWRSLGKKEKAILKTAKKIREGGESQNV